MPTTTPSVCSHEYIWMLLAVVIIYVFGFYTLGRVGMSAFKDTQEGKAKSFGLLFQRAVPALTIAMVMLVVAVLSPIGKLSEGVIAILTAIASFTLAKPAPHGESPKKPDESK